MNSGKRVTKVAKAGDRLVVRINKNDVLLEETRRAGYAEKRGVLKNADRTDEEIIKKRGPVSKRIY
jgi:hypothetical protein